MERPGYSPSFKRPADVMRQRRKRARSEGPGRVPVTAATPPPGASPLAQGRGAGRKRRNPFASIENRYESPAKRAENPAGRPAGIGPALQEHLLLENRAAEAPLEKAASLSDERSLFEEDDKVTPETTSSIEDVPPASAVCGEYPADWSMKTRLLFTSSLSFSWAEHPKAQEEALGLTQHCRAEHSSVPQNMQEPRSCPELRRSFQQCLQYWQHPSLPWLSLFPRIGAERKFAGKSAPWSQDSSVQQSMMSEWSVSLTSLYSLLKARLCPYFYLCSYQFTALFRASGVGGSSGLTALLAPTTRGLREAMKAEGIEFTLPLLDEKRKEPQPTDREDTPGSVLGKVSDQDEGNGDEGEVDDDDDDDGFSWLEEMGVQDKIKKPDSISIKLRKERNAVCLDHRPESVVLVDGAHTHTLINFLINCKSLVAAAGSQAGLPPTLLAPAAFRGATLHTLKARSVNVKTQVRTGYQDVCSLEVTGAIMPHALHALTQLLKPAQRGAFSATIYTHEPTAVLNVAVGKDADPVQQHLPDDLMVKAAVESLSRCGLAPGSLRQMAEPASLGKSALRQLHMRDYGYSWKI
ncbi:protein downstream neighbor of Son [Denticeps clupeoides]|uniref:Protein downstream neighbor of Son n=1 Tax=Denticeps clupeoides TaxID=299321 RepID=A0AAY4A8R3_9TELE|nr:protein downstream neighbor of Son [Denticeps clupeoides]